MVDSSVLTWSIGAHGRLNKISDGPLRASSGGEPDGICDNPKSNIPWLSIYMKSDIEPPDPMPNASGRAASLSKLG